jgi:hypothetical protein
LLLLTGCQVTLTAGIDARPDGSGSIRAGLGLDDAALREVGDLASELRLDDLRQAGWEVTGPRKEENDGLTWVRLSKRFVDEAHAASVAAELSGPDGPFRDFKLERSRSFLKTTMRFTGLVDLSRGLTGLSDAALQERLGGYDLRLDRPEADVRVRVEARLPGRDRIAWEPRLGDQLRLEARSEAWNLRPLLPAALAVLLAAAAVAALAWGGRR